MALEGYILMLFCGDRRICGIGKYTDARFVTIEYWNLYQFFLVFEHFTDTSVGIEGFTEGKAEGGHQG